MFPVWLGIVVFVVGIGIFWSRNKFWRKCNIPLRGCIEEIYLMKRNVIGDTPLGMRFLKPKDEYMSQEVNYMFAGCQIFFWPLHILLAILCHCIALTVWFIFITFHRLGYEVTLTNKKETTPVV